MDKFNLGKKLDGFNKAKARLPVIVANIAVNHF